MADSFGAWRARHSETLYSIYAVFLFSFYVIVMSGAAARGEFRLDPLADALTIGLWYAFGLYIVLQGFPTPQGAYVSLDRISQVAMVLLFSAPDAALVNSLVSFTYPLIRQRAQYGVGGALFRCMHNSAMFGLMIYFAGIAWQAAGGAVPLLRLDWQAAFALAVLVLSMQFINTALYHLRGWVMGIAYEPGIDWFSHFVELPVAVVGVLLALVCERMDLPAIGLFFALLMAIVAVAKVLNDASVALQERKEELEQKVRDRVADIERQGEALVAVNHQLEDANRRQEQLLRSLQATSEELERQNREDPLTGMYNRRHMDQFLRREHERALRLGLPLTVAMIDIDHFKSVNDTFSHQAGDLVLQAMARVLVENVRTLDLVARYGGEEIVLCMPDTALDDARQVCERAREAIEALNWGSIAPGLALTASFGLAQAQPGGDVASLLKACDARLYEAKNGGRNQVRY